MKKIYYAIILLNSFVVFLQKEKKVIGDFDEDTKTDMLYYKDFTFDEQFRNIDISYKCKS